MNASLCSILMVVCVHVYLWLHLFIEIHRFKNFVRRGRKKKRTKRNCYVPHFSLSNPMWNETKNLNSLILAAIATEKYAEFPLYLFVLSIFQFILWLNSNSRGNVRCTCGICSFTIIIKKLNQKDDFVIDCVNILIHLARTLPWIWESITILIFILWCCKRCPSR